MFAYLCFVCHFALLIVYPAVPFVKLDRRLGGLSLVSLFLTQGFLLLNQQGFQLAFYSSKFQHISVWIMAKSINKGNKAKRKKKKKCIHFLKMIINNNLKPSFFNYVDCLVLTNWSLTSLVISLIPRNFSSLQSCILYPYSKWPPKTS